MIPLLYNSLSLLSLAFILLITLKLLLQTGRFENLPPCPPTLPTMGNLRLLKSPPFHRSLHALSQTYGHIFSLWLGSRLVVIISSETLAQHCVTKHDIVLANRPSSITFKYLLYNCNTLGSSSYGDHWRNLRRITTTDVFSTQRLNSFLETKRDVITRGRGIRKLVEDTSMGFTRVQLRPRLSEMSFNNIMRMVSGKKYYGDDGNLTVTDAEEAREFREIIAEILSLTVANSLGDSLPLLRWLDFDGLVRRVKRISERADAFLQRLLEEHRSGKHSNNSMIDHFLSLQKVQPEYYSDYIIKGIIQDMLIGGTHTIAVTLEWALSALLNHPDVSKKAKNELDTHVGKHRLVDQSDILNLPYLQNIIYETLRLYTPGPLLAIT